MGDSMRKMDDKAQSAETDESSKQGRKKIWSKFGSQRSKKSKTNQPSNISDNKVNITEAAKSTEKAESDPKNATLTITTNASEKSELDLNVNLTKTTNTSEKSESVPKNINLTNDTNPSEKNESELEKSNLAANVNFSEKIESDPKMVNLTKTTDASEKSELNDKNVNSTITTNPSEKCDMDPKDFNLTKATDSTQKSKSDLEKLNLNKTANPPEQCESDSNKINLTQTTIPSTKSESTEATDSSEKFESDAKKINLTEITNISEKSESVPESSSKTALITSPNKLGPNAQKKMKKSLSILDDIEEKDCQSEPGTPIDSKSDNPGQYPEGNVENKTVENSPITPNVNKTDATPEAKSRPPLLRKSSSRRWFEITQNKVIGSPDQEDGPIGDQTDDGVDGRRTRRISLTKANSLLEDLNQVSLYPKRVTIYR